MQSQYTLVNYGQWRQKQESSFPEDPEFSSLAKAVFSYLDKIPNLRKVIVEKGYVDSDYSSAYAHFYSHSFKPPSGICTRHLFFSEPFGTVEEVHDSRIANSFRGYLTIWPTYPRVIGRSVLPLLDGTEDHLIAVKAPYSAHVAGKKLTLESAMFASKDHGVSACATIATWLATDLLHRKFDLRTCSSTEVTLLATVHDPKWGRPLPQKYGLDSQQIVKVLDALDYGPYVHDLSSAEIRDLLKETNQRKTWVGKLYGYIVSGIPVIISLTMREGAVRHMVLAVGLRLSGKAPAKLGHLRTSSFSHAVTAILVHDDRYGPFGELTIEEAEPLRGVITYQDGSREDVGVETLIIPLPREISLVSDDAHLYGITLLRQLIAKVLKEEEYKGPYQTHLQEAIDVKASTCMWNSDMQNVGEAIRFTPMPKWVWITEAYRPDDLQRAYPIARVILDPTQLKFAKDNLFLIGHVTDTLIPAESIANGLPSEADFDDETASDKTAAVGVKS